jgi:hypothetical protein
MTPRDSPMIETPVTGAVPDHRYLAYGLRLRSDRLLPELEHDPGEAYDVIIRRADLGRKLPDLAQFIVEFTASTAYIAFGTVGHFAVHADGLVEYDLVPEADESILGLVILGVVSASLLQLRGQLALHASAIDIAGRGVVFMGNKGAGKSTTAAAFIRAGHRLLADDVLPVQLDPAPPRLVPGFAQLKLSTAAMESIALPEATSTPIPGLTFHKSRLRFASAFSGQTVPAARFYVLQAGDRLQASPLEGPAALAALMANTYMARFGSQFFTGARAAAHLRQCATLLAAVPVRTLEIPPGLDRLAELVAFVEQDSA